MKILKQILFITAAVFCFSMMASAQRPQPTPTPKDKPPVIIIVPDKTKPGEDKPKNDDKKKPNGEVFAFSRKFE